MLRDSIEQFFITIAPWERAYTTSSFSFAAIRVANGFSILQARLLVNTLLPPIALEFFETPNILAGHFLLSDVGMTPQQAIDALLSGKLETPKGPVLFAGNATGEYGGFFQAFHPDGLLTQERIPALTLLGGSLQEMLAQPQLDWEVKAADRPHEDLQELLYTYRLGNLRPDVASIEVAALRVIMMDLGTRVSGEKAALTVRMSPLLDREAAAIGYRALSKGAATRGIVRGPDLKWRTDGDVAVGETEIDVPAASAIHAYASYAGVAHHQGWIFDPANAQNARRASYEAFDPNLTALSELLSRAPGRGNSRDLEAAVGWALWMLGFSVAHLGGTTRLQEAPDLLATTQTGQVAVIECTTGLLKADNKLALLLDRTESVRERLRTSNNDALKVIPIIVTTKTRIEVRADLEQAQRLGVLVITRETLDTALGRTLVQPDADAIYREGEQAIADALARYQDEPMLPGIAGISETRAR